MSLVGPLGGIARDPGAPATYIVDVDSGPPWEVMTEIRERPPPVLKISMASPLGGDNGDLGASTIYFEDINGGTHGRR
jgi:hypothetical protein